MEAATAQTIYVYIEPDSGAVSSISQAARNTNIRCRSFQSRFATPVPGCSP
jgi:hypothetical protein